MDKVIIEGVTREGNVESRKMKKDGKIPAVVYGKETKTMPIEIKIKDIEKTVKTLSEGALLITLKLTDKKEEKIVKAQAFIDAKRLYDTVAEANAVAESSQEYKDWKERWENSLADVKLLENKRETEKVIWETWRTEQANLRNT